MFYVYNKIIGYAIRVKMAANEIELKNEIAKIKNSAFDVKDHFHDLFQQLLPETLMQGKNISVVDELINQDTLPEALSKKYEKTGYVLFLYAHKPHNPNIISHINNDKNPIHSSLLLCKVTEGTINQILNIDGYDYQPFMDILGRRPGAAPNPYIKNRLVIDAQSSFHSQKEPLQAPSWYNLNCLIYAFTFAQAILNTIDFSPEVIDNLFVGNSSEPSAVSLDNLKAAIIQGVEGKYVKQVQTSGKIDFYRDSRAATIYHDSIRNQLAETLTAKYHAALVKPQEFVPITIENGIEIKSEQVVNPEVLIDVNDQPIGNNEEIPSIDITVDDLAAAKKEKTSDKPTQTMPSVVPVSIFNKSQAPSSIAKLTLLCTEYQTHLYTEIKRLTHRDPEIVIREYVSTNSATELDVLINKTTIVTNMINALKDSNEPSEFIRIKNMNDVLTPEAKETLSEHRSTGGKFLQVVLNVISTVLMQNWKYRAKGEEFSDSIQETPAKPSFNG